MDIHRHFAKAAKACHVTQPTLSMMIQKLEDELGEVLFDRSKHPVVPTELGTQVINQARNILAESKKLRELVNDNKGIVQGTLNIGMLPTIAPYVVPFIINPMAEHYPLVKVRVFEHSNNEIIALLKSGVLDAGILTTPLNTKGINTKTLFYDRFFVFSPIHPIEDQWSVSDVKENLNWLLSKGHVFRDQVTKYLGITQIEEGAFEYQVGHLESLKQLVKAKPSLAIIPELSTLTWSDEDKKWLKPFKGKSPAREIGLATHRNDIKRKLIEVLDTVVSDHVPLPKLTGKMVEVINVL